MGEHLTYINLEALHKLCKGDIIIKDKYLHRFLEMMPISIQKLKFASEQKDRTAIMKELHFMSPQLVFYGIESITNIIERENTKRVLSFKDLKNQLDKSIIKLEKALKEVENIIDK